ncbi:MAG: BREX system ATP-binding domain-containing protein, partial [Candidatus Aenigmatarchaeota archaeon]
MVSSTARERILLHLGSYEIYLDRDEVPYGITQPGIAEAVGVSRSHVSYEIKGLMEKEELVREEIRRVEDQKRKRKVYFLTAKGLEVCDDIRGRFEDGYITVITCEGKKQVELNEIDDYLEGRDPLLKALSMIDDDDDDYALDLRKGEPSGERIFVGREEELERMKNLLGGVEKGDSRTLFIVGEPGIGKTTLVSEFSQYAKKKGFKFLEGKAYFETAAPFLPLREIFDDLRPDMKEDRLDIFDVEKGNKFEEEEILKSQRKAAFYQSAEVIKEVSKDIPLVLFIDDLQWADGSTLKLLHYLSESLKKCRVFFLGAFRPMGSRKNRFLDDICRRMKRENRFESIELKPLDRDQTKEIISNIMAVKDPPSKFVELIYEYCEGNPLFTEECIKKLAEEGTIDPKKGLYPHTKDELEVPDVVTRVLEGRFDRYSDETREVLEYGSVIGETIPYELLLESSGMEERTMLKHISHLLRSDLWHEASEQEVFRFSHTLFKFAAYRSIPELKREKLHEVVSGSIKEVYADDLENYYSDIAMHLEKSDNIEEALKFFILAGQRAEKVYAQEEALEMYEKALELVEELSDEIKKGEILESLGDVNKVLGNYGNCIENYQGSMLSIEDEKHRQRMYRKIAAVNLKRSSFEEAIQQVDNGLSLLGLGSKSAKEERCRLLQKKGWAL